MGQAAVSIPEKIYFKIGEVCELVGVQAHVLRYWETEFAQLSPQKNRSGQRSYRRRDVEIALRIKELLYDEMFTIAGARKKLQAEARGEVPKLKIVRPGSAEEAAGVPSTDAPGLFDDELEISDIVIDGEPASAPVIKSMEIDGDRREALRSLAAQLLELREMLKTDQTREASEHLRNRGV
jgi:DNA-binding transcriptional MerR regulator